jgi:hypothetical protein
MNVVPGRSRKICSRDVSEHLAEEVFAGFQGVHKHIVNLYCLVEVLVSGVTITWWSWSGKRMELQLCVHSVP